MTKNDAGKNAARGASGAPGTDLPPGTVTRKLMLYFPKCETEKPIVYHLVKDYNLIVNIFRARVTPEEEGYLVLDVSGSDADISGAIRYLSSFGVTVDEANKGVVWDEERCTACGNCLSHCPTHALSVTDARSRRIEFRSSLCIECLSCVKVCPFRAVRSVF